MRLTLDTPNADTYEITAIPVPDDGAPHHDADPGHVLITIYKCKSDAPDAAVDRSQDYGVDFPGEVFAEMTEAQLNGHRYVAFAVAMQKFRKEYALRADAAIQADAAPISGLDPDPFVAMLQHGAERFDEEEEQEYDVRLSDRDAPPSLDRIWARLRGLSGTVRYGEIPDGLREEMKMISNWVETLRRRADAEAVAAVEGPVEF